MMVQLRVVFLILIQCTVILITAKTRFISGRQSTQKRNLRMHILRIHSDVLFPIFYATGENEICYIT